MHVWVHLTPLFICLSVARRIRGNLPQQISGGCTHSVAFNRLRSTFSCLLSFLSRQPLCPATHVPNWPSKHQLCHIFWAMVIPTQPRLAPRALVSLPSCFSPQSPFLLLWPTAPRHGTWTYPKSSFDLARTVRVFLTCKAPSGAGLGRRCPGPSPTPSCLRYFKWRWKEDGRVPYCLLYSLNINNP